MYSLNSNKTHFLGYIIRTWIDIDIHTHIHTHIHMYIHTYKRTYIHIYTHTYTHTYVYTYIHTNAHTYTYTNGDQTVDHLIYECNKLNNEREKLIAHISKEDKWPIRKSELVKKYLKQVIHFTNSIDYEKL